MILFGVFNIGGRFYGLPNVCPHQTGPLCAGRVATGTLVADGESDWKPFVQKFKDCGAEAIDWIGAEQRAALPEPRDFEAYGWCDGVLVQRAAGAG